MTVAWTSPPGTIYNFDTPFSENEYVDQLLPTISDVTGITFTVITGKLPAGLELYHNYIRGTTINNTVIDSVFVIRASDGINYDDRTFEMTVDKFRIWNIDSGSFLTENPIQEDVETSILLPVIPRSLDTITFSIISGELPPGLRLEDEIIDGVRTIHITGNPFEVAHDTTWTFVIRASNGINLSDRTLKLTVTGADVPIWLTPSGILPINPTGQTFVLDNTYIDYQLSAIDADLAAGQNLEFFIQEGDGDLPPGLTLNSDGSITGFIDPVLSLEVSAGTGYYDCNLYDSSYYDFGSDYEEGSYAKHLSRYYKFIVSVSDGDTISKREFLIYVVGDDFLRADNTIIQVGNGAFTADNTYLRAPFWLTPSNLGIKRANNYVTILLNAFDPNPQIGPVKYKLELLNDDNSVSTIPLGMSLDTTRGELFGYIPYQPAVTTEYKFTISATKYETSRYSISQVYLHVIETAQYGQNYFKISPLTAEDQVLILNVDIQIGIYRYTISSYQSIDSSAALIYIKQFLYQNVNVNEVIVYDAFISESEYTAATSTKTFFLNVIGEIDSTIYWTTSFDLGDIRANVPCLLSVNAISSVPKASLQYSVVNGELPPGLQLLRTGEIVGTPRQFGTNGYIGLTSFDKTEIETTFDKNLTSFDRSYTFDILAEDQFKYSAIVGTFTLNIDAIDERQYSNIYVRPYQRQDKRIIFSNFITNTNIFTPSKIYRPYDKNFGVQTDLLMLFYAGIETLRTDDYIPSMILNTKKKRYRLGSPTTAIAKYQGSNNIEYEVIYLPVYDDYEINGNSAASRIKLNYSTNPVRNNNYAYLDAKEEPALNSNDYELNMREISRFSRINTAITADIGVIDASNTQINYVYPSSTTNMRNNLKNTQVGTERTAYSENAYLPLWMTTPQNNLTGAAGFIKAVPLCYCLPNQSKYILKNILNSNFDFTQIDYQFDRYIISEVAYSDGQPTFLKFRDYEFNI